MAERQPFLTVPEFAKATAVTGQTVRAWIRSGRLRADKLGRDYLIPADELDRILDRAGGAE